MDVRTWRSTLLLLAILVRIPALAQRVEFTTISPEVIEARLKQVDVKQVRRKENLVKLFEEAGCTEGKLSEQSVKGSRFPNVICTMPGSGDAVIIVGAHYDHVSVGQGAVDNWSGAALLPSLFESLKDMPRRHTLVFVGFTDEEAGLVGSRFYAGHLTKDQRAKTLAMVNMDSLGLASSKVWLSHADPQLAKALFGVANAMKLPLQGVNVDKVGSTDSESFTQIHIPAITIHSITQETYPILHTPRDMLKAIHLEDYYQTFKMTAGYLAYLDGTLGQTPAAPPP